MNFNSSFLSNHISKHLKLKYPLHPKKIKYSYLLLIFLPLFLFSSCASSKKFSNENNIEIESGALPVRILINEEFSGFRFNAESTIKIADDDRTIALVKKGNRINIKPDGGKLLLTIGTQSFSSRTFRFSSEKINDIFSFNGKKYRGSILISSNGKIVNVISLEDYLKGVVPAEMPVGKDNRNFEALKAFTICARTYTMMRLNEKKPDFDLYIDVRDQVYGGADNEYKVSNQAITETRGMVLEYQGDLATIFYHSSCGGYTEEGANVFAGGEKPYLTSVKDGSDPYCIIAPKFQWEEKYNKEVFTERLVKKGLIPPADFTLESIKINSRFNSGRVNELEIDLVSSAGESKSIKIYGNQIRSIIRTSDNNSILRSTMFEINFDGEIVSITGKGYGHGVGLCQWGAIAQSRNGTGYEEILSHYFPGTRIKIED